MKAEYEMNHRINKLSVLAMALVLAGCTMAPDYERPSAPTSSSYPSGAAYAQGTVSAAQTAVADIGWRDFYRDPLLQQLLEVALANNRDLRKSVLDVEAARAQYRIRRADMLPTLNVDAGATVQRLPADVSPSGTTQITRSYDVNGAVSAWELDLWGRVRSLSDRALATYLALDETRIAARLSLLAEVTNAYLTLRADQELLQLAHDTLSTQKRTYALTQALFDACNATQIDLRRAEIALRTAEVSQAAYTRVAAQDRNALVLLLGQPLTAELSASLDKANTLPDDIIPSALPAGLPAELLVRRPDVRAAATACGQCQYRGRSRGIFPGNQFDRIGWYGQFESGRVVRAGVSGLEFCSANLVAYFPGRRSARQSGPSPGTKAHRNCELREGDSGCLPRSG